MTRDIKLIKRFVTGLFLCVSVFLVVVLYSQGSNGEGEVVFFDVGQGDCSLINLKGDIQVLIDGGPDNVVLSKLNQYMPFYDRSIELVILTHPHADHVTGLVGVLERYEVNKVMITGVTHTSEAYMKFLELIKEKNIEIFKTKDTMSVDLGNGNMLDVIYPWGDFWGKDVENLNNNSIVVRFSSQGGKSFLLVGDIEKEAEDLILSVRTDLRASVLKVAHHGAGTSSGEEFLKIIKPDMAVISVGENNYGHPNIGVIRRLEKMGTIVRRTDKEGDVVFGF